MELITKRIYDKAEKADGLRILVDRLWPRGVSKARARIDDWMKDIAPSDALRKWFAHDPTRWETFKRRYADELDGKGDLVDSIVARSKKGRVTLLYGAKETRFNNAIALREYVMTRRGRCK